MEIKGTEELVNSNIGAKFLRFLPSCHNGAVLFGLSDTASRQS